MIALLGCTEVPRESANETARSLESTSTDPEGARASGEAATAQAIVVAWQDDAPSTRTNSLAVRVENTTAEIKLVDLTLVSVDPRGQEVTRPLGEEAIPALGSLSISIPIADLPAQSIRLPSSITVVARYEQTQPAVLAGEAPAQLSLQASSAIRYITFDSGFQMATSRSEVEQVRINTASFKAALPRPLAAGELRRYNAAKRIVEVEDTAAFGGDELVFVTKGRRPTVSAGPANAGEQQ